MNKEEFKELFEKNIAYLQACIPPDDIYPFTEETYMAALFFLKKWSDLVNIEKELEKDPIAKKWAKNLLTFLYYRDRDVVIQLDLGLEEDNVVEQ